ncbi:TrbG/VirB9 family P-type conjugative transfer protein [Caulobacter segnis]|uniref:TrbG/VirB9 family P-type conjugative transfer protein n=1 Tax=Caulobacter segnis TaxID=88688 RepID=UPI00241043E2|nr:TrbG/VirB9 family P-type conjugative transfer protein [Caulobacter segnis]MDG2520510.1 TrbG/VirB9 family P-type conjugative transfer protein [Caulobacter segnis]
MMHIILICLALLAPAAAQAADSRIRTVDYDPDAVVRIEGRFSTAVQIVLAEGEEILHVALGDSAAWEAAPEGRLLFLKPLAARTTNLIVASRAPDGSTRNYAFELRVAKSPGPWMVRFSYPAAERAKVAALIDAKEAALRRRLQQLRLDRGAVEGPRNLAWSLQGAAALQPSEVSDNGRFTVMRFPGGQAVPAVFAVASDGEESLIPFDVRGEFVVVHGVHAQLRLRQGAQMLCLWNEAYDPRAGGAASGTATTSVRRIDKESRP